MGRGFYVEVQVDLGDARRVAQRVRNLGEDPEPLLNIAGAVLEASTRRRFDEGKGPGGVPWPATKRQIRGAVGAKGPVKNKILVNTGSMQDSVRYEVRPGEVEVGIDGLTESARTAPIHQRGSHRQAVVLGHTRTITSAFGVPLPNPKTINVRPHGMMTNLPARPIVGVDDEDRRDLADAWQDHLRSLFE